MSRQIRNNFLFLILAQGLHSIEEYMGKLWEAFPPARFLTGLVSPDHREGFIIINTGLFLFGLWCWLYPVRKNHKIARQLIFIWLVIEFINGVGHPFWSIRLQSYTPGLATSLLLLFLSIRITIMFFRDNSDLYTKNKIKS